MKIKKKYVSHIIFILPLFLATVCLIRVTLGSHQATLPFPLPQTFIGEYSFDGQNWKSYREDALPSALEGDLFLRGHFLNEMAEGSQLNFYRNHIGVSIQVNGSLIYIDDFLTIPELHADLFASMCAREWITFPVPQITPDDMIEIRLHNPHIYGNKTAYADFLTSLCSDPAGSTLLQENLLSYGNQFYVAGGFLMIASLMLLGASLAAALSRITASKSLLKLGLSTLFSGGYIVFDTIDISYWSKLNILNTYTYSLCMMLAAFFLSHLISDILTGKKQFISRFAVLLSALLNSILILLSFSGATTIYDTLPYWSASQAILCLLFMCCLVLESVHGSNKRFLLISAFSLYAAILLDIAGVGSNIVWRAPCSKVVFLCLFIVYGLLAAKGIINNHHASIRAKKLEKDLEDSRIAIMLSQIKPHFLYNVLNTIYHLCQQEPETAQTAIRSFADYLRCNMLSIESNNLIPFAEEYQHIQTYLSLEQLRFQNKLDVVYDITVTDFKLPPLSVEPLVENAVKHGVTKIRGGGIVTISTRKTGNAYTITVADTGSGFDPDTYAKDGNVHIGIASVRSRLESMVGGTLSITSSPCGTVATVTIPAPEAGLNLSPHS